MFLYEGSKSEESETSLKNQHPKDMEHSPLEYMNRDLVALSDHWPLVFTDLPPQKVLKGLQPYDS